MSHFKEKKVILSTIDKENFIAYIRIIVISHNKIEMILFERSEVQATSVCVELIKIKHKKGI